MSSISTNNNQTLESFSDYVDRIESISFVVSFVILAAVAIMTALCVIFGNQTCRSRERHINSDSCIRQEPPSPSRLIEISLSPRPTPRVYDGDEEPRDHFSSEQNERS